MTLKIVKYHHKWCEDLRLMVLKKDADNAMYGVCEQGENVMENGNRI